MMTCRLFTTGRLKFRLMRRQKSMRREIIFIDEDSLTKEEWEAIADEQAEEQGRIPEGNG